MTMKYSILLALTLSLLSGCSDDSVSGNPDGSSGRVTIKDESPPEITLLGNNPMTVEGGSTFVDPGSTVYDTVDQNLTATVSGLVDTGAVGTYLLYYNVKDTSGNSATTVTRTVNVQDTTAPVITLNGASPITIEGGATFQDPGVTVTDNVDNLAATISGSVDTSVVGSYVLTYSVTDRSGNTAKPVSRTVIVQDTIEPVITVDGNNPLTLLKDSVFTDPGTTVTDNIDTGLIASVSGTVDTSVAGTYTLTYSATDSSGNTAAPVTRNVRVVVLQAPSPSMTIDVKSIQFSWSVIDGADHYNILVNPDGVSGFSVEPSSGNLSSTTHTLDIPVHLTNWQFAQYIVEACDAKETQCASSSSLSLTLADSVTATGYFKATNTGASDLFGLTIAMSSDGNTLAVGAPGESSAATGINNAVIGQTDNSFTNSGAVYVFLRSGTEWAQQAYIKASNTGADDGFGTALSLSGDGNTLAVGAPYEDSADVSIGGDQTDDTAPSAGAVYVFLRSGNTWTQEAYIKASTTGAGDEFGQSIALSDDSNTLAVGAPQEDSASDGVDNGTPGESDNSAIDSGAAYVFTRSFGVWSQEAWVKASNTGAGDAFGSSISLSEDGNTLAAGAYLEASAATGVNNTIPGQGDNSATESGAVYVYTRTGTAWTPHSYIKASNTEASDWFGYRTVLSDSGTTLAVSAPNEGSASTGINSTTPGQADNSAAAAGATYIFYFSGSTWGQQAYIKAPNTEANDEFGHALDLSSDGSMLAVGGWLEDSASLGVGGSYLDNSALNAGAAFVFLRASGIWVYKSYIKAGNAEAGDRFGSAVALSADGNTLAGSAQNEDSGDTGISADQTDNTETDAGAVYVY